MIRKHMGKYLHYYEVDGWEFCSRKTVPYREGNIKSDAVVIVPIFNTRGQSKIATIKEYRIPAGNFTYGFPAGLIDEGETSVQAAMRELKEETGLDVVEHLYTTPPLFSSEGLTDEVVEIVYLLVEGTTSIEYLESNENIETSVLNRNEVKELLSQRVHFGKIGYMVLQDFVNTGFGWIFEKKMMETK